MDRSQRDGLLLLLLAAAGYAFFPIFTKTIFESGRFEPLDVLFLRFLLATPITWLVIWRLRHSLPHPKSLSTNGEGLPARPPPPLQVMERGSGGEVNRLPRLRLMGMGALFAFTAGSAFFALERIPASTFTVVLYSYPAIVALYSLLLGEQLSRRGWVALGLTIVGIILTVPEFGAGFTDMLGVGLTLLNAVIYALYIVVSGRLLRGHTALAEASAWSITGTFVFVTVIVMVVGIGWPADLSQWGNLVAMAVISTVIPIFAFYAGMQKLGAARAAILSTTEPVFTLALAFLLLGERILPVQLLGAALILVSVILLQLGRAEQPAIASEQQTGTA